MCGKVEFLTYVSKEISSEPTGDFGRPPLSVIKFTSGGRRVFGLQLEGEICQSRENMVVGVQAAHHISAFVRVQGQMSVHAQRAFFFVCSPGAQSRE